MAGEIDPVLMQLFAASRQKGANRNASSVLGNLDNPYLAYLAGVYDPVSAEMMNEPSSDLIARYAGDPNYPAVNQVIQQIQAGMDPYQISSFATALSGGEPVDNFQPSDFERLAVDMQKEYSSGGKSGKPDIWQKAGLRNPLDRYSEMDVPMSKDLMRMIAGIRQGAEPARKMRTQAGTALSRAKMEEKLNRSTLEEIASEFERGRTLTSGGAARGLGDLANWLRSQESLSPQDLERGVQKFAPSQEFELRPFKQAVKTVKSRMDKQGLGYKGVPNKAEQRRKAEEEAGLMQQQVNAAQEAERAVRRGAVRAYEEAGRTPTRDQLVGIMRFLTGK